jgi:hypothetical protein
MVIRGVQRGKCCGQIFIELTVVRNGSSYADFVNEDEEADPKVGRGVVIADHVVPLKREGELVVWAIIIGVDCWRIAVDPQGTHRLVALFRNAVG